MKSQLQEMFGMTKSSYSKSCSVFVKWRYNSLASRHPWTGIFQVMAVDSGYGGLEHRASTSLICTKKSLPWGEKRTDAYIQFWDSVHTSIFSTWNVKRIKPAVFQPYNLNRETYTSLLWVFEGWTSYYDDLILLRCDLISTEQYLTLIGKTITRVYKGSALHKQSLADSSFTAWTKFYRQDENAPNAVISYYAKGALAALALDLYIRRETGNQKSLDDVMKALWTEFGSKGIGVPEDGVERLSERITGLDLSEWFDAVVRGVGTLPLEELLSTVGVDLRAREPKSHADLGRCTLLHKSRLVIWDAPLSNPQQALRCDEVLMMAPLKSWFIIRGCSDCHQWNKSDDRQHDSSIEPIFCW